MTPSMNPARVLNALVAALIAATGRNAAPPMMSPLPVRTAADRPMVLINLVNGLMAALALDAALLILPPSLSNAAPKACTGRDPRMDDMPSLRTLKETLTVLNALAAIPALVRAALPKRRNPCPAVATARPTASATGPIAWRRAWSPPIALSDWRETPISILAPNRARVLLIGSTILPATRATAFVARLTAFRTGVTRSNARECDP